VIDELMGHQRSRGGDLEGGSRIGARHRHTTPEMAARVVQTLDTRLTLTLHVAEATTRAEPNLENPRVLARRKLALADLSGSTVCGLPAARME
jgi:hypothetical protein